MKYICTSKNHINFNQKIKSCKDREKNIEYKINQNNKEFFSVKNLIFIKKFKLWKDKDKEKNKNNYICIVLGLFASNNICVFLYIDFGYIK